ncbi:hybrid sensor histidine kinase/response regulator [Roseibium sp. SCPC15]|uniref:ATP-binding response regulator n=1 Tax=Roseibium sp. SCP15 TaxID=3141376 RepID=UPI00333D7332
MADHDDDGVKLALLAHDLRTPLSAMRLTAELIGNGPLDVSQAEHLSTLIRSIDVLTDMTAALIQKAEPGKDAGEVLNRVSEIVAESADLFRAAADAKSLAFDVGIEDTARACMTPHGSTVRRVVAALLDNAIKYTERGRVELSLQVLTAEGGQVSAERASEWISLSISDSGPGIDAEERARLFRPFVRGRRGRETGQGSGLGLWGTAQLVEEMSGRLLLTPSDLGGTRFEIQIPVTMGEGGLPISSARAEQETGFTACQLPVHVLIVDDNDTNCRLLAALLESFGITAEIAKSGEEALALVEENAFEAVLLDLNMPGMSGVDTAIALRKVRSPAELPLIAVSAASDTVGETRLRDAGFQDVLAKPLAPRTLYEAMERARSGKGPAKE